MTLEPARPVRICGVVLAAALVLVPTSIPGSFLFFGPNTSQLRAGTVLVPQEFATIQSGILAADEGDTVVVSAGTYCENIDFLGKALTLRSRSGPQETIIDGARAGVVVRFVNGEGVESVIDGFTIRGGLPRPTVDAQGGGILCVASSPTITRNVIAENLTYWGGAGVYTTGGSPIIVGNVIRDNGFTCLIADAPCGAGAGIFSTDGAPIIQNNIFHDNTAPASGGAIFCGEDSHALIRGNRIVDNIGGFGGGITCTSNAQPLIFSNLIQSNDAVGFLTLGGPVLGVGGGIVVEFDSAPTIASSTILANRALSPSGVPTGRGGGVAFTSTQPISIVNSILWQNQAMDGTEILVDTAAALSVTYSDVAGGFVGTGNFSADPLFASGPLGSFYLSHIAAGQGADSPCIDAGDPNSSPVSGTTRTDAVGDFGPVDVGFHLFDPLNALFLRGDANADGVFSGLADGLFVLTFQFVPGAAAPPCFDAADADDDGAVSGLVDGLLILNFQFVPGSPPPAPPGPVQCGLDSTFDTLDCAALPPC